MSTRSTCVAAITGIAAVLLAACAVSNAPPPPEQSASSAGVHLAKFEADDNPIDDPGGPGEKRAMDYTKAYFEKLGLTTIVQSVPLVEMVPQTTSVRLRGPKGGVMEATGEGARFLLWHGQQKERTSLESEVVFVGYGITSPEYGRDDYKGVNVRGKIVLVLEGSPHTGKRDDLGVLGETHYGTRFYKYEEGARRGAAAVLIIHSLPTPPWEVIEAEDSGSVIDIDQAAVGSTVAMRPEVEGWISLPAAMLWFTAAGLSYDNLLTKAYELAFTPITIPGIHVILEMTSRMERRQSQDVIALLPGQTPEYLMLAGRWNRIDPDAWTHTFTPPTGVVPGTPEAIAASIASARAQKIAALSDDDDDGSGAAMIMEAAQRLVSSGIRPVRGIAFMVTSALKSGTLGLEYYLEHPPALMPIDKLVAFLFLDRADLEGKSKRVGKIGNDSDGALSQITREAAIEQGRLVEIDQAVETRFYYTLSQNVLEAKGVRVIYLTTRPAEDKANHLRRVVDLDPQHAVLAPPAPPDPSRDAAFIANITTRVANATNWPPRIDPAVGEATTSH